MPTSTAQGFPRREITMRSLCARVKIASRFFCSSFLGRYSSDVLRCLPGLFFSNGPDVHEFFIFRHIVENSKSTHAQFPDGQLHKPWNHDNFQSIVEHVKPRQSVHAHVLPPSKTDVGSVACPSSPNHRPVPYMCWYPTSTRNPPGAWKKKVQAPWNSLGVFTSSPSDLRRW